MESAYSGQHQPGDKINVINTSEVAMRVVFTVVPSGTVFEVILPPGASTQATCGTESINVELVDHEIDHPGPGVQLVR